jgi:hypothetical protein
VRWDFTEPSEPVPTQQPIACSEEATQRPQGPLGTVRVGLLVIHNRSNQPLVVYRLDANGRRIRSGDVGPASSGSFYALDEAITPSC